MKNVIEKQKSSNIINFDRSDTLKAETIAKKTSETQQAVNDTLVKALTEESGNSLNSNIVKLFKEVKKQTSLMDNAEKASDVTKKSLDMDQFKTISERMSDFKKGFKDFFSVKGFLNKTGIVDKDSTGIVATAINRRAAKKQYAEDRMKVDPNYWRIAKGDTDEEKKANARKTFEKQFDQQQEIKKQQRQNEGEISRLEKGGYTEEQIKRSGLLKTRAGLAEKLTAVDSRVRDNAGDSTAGNTKKQLEVESKKKQKDKETIKEAMEFSDEGQLENQRQAEKQTELLNRIAENTDSLRRGGAKKEKKEGGEESGGGLLGTIMGFLGEGFISALKLIFNPKNILKAITKFIGPAIIIGALVNGIMDGFNKFMETGDIAEALIAGLGGILSFLTFGLFDAETIKSVVNAVSGFITDFIIEPVKKFISFIGDAFEKYITEPIMNAFGYIGDLFTQYIIDPIKKFFAPITNFFMKIKEQVFGFLEDFGIPEIGFTIPIIGKKVSIGPFYPFRPEEGSNRVSTNSGLDQADSAAGSTSNFNQNIVTSGKTAYANKDGSVTYGRDETTVFSEGEKVVNGQATYASNLATFDPVTGKAIISGDVGDREISKRAFDKIKANAKSGGDATAVQEIVKEDDAYQKLSFWDKRKVDVGYAKASDLLAAQQSTGGADAVYDKSSQNAAAAASPGAAPAPVVINAPTNVSNSKQNIALPQAVRNPDSGFNRYASSRAVVL